MGETFTETEHGAADNGPDAPDHSTVRSSAMATAKRNTSPAFQFYPKDFLSSSKVQRMSLTERGIYICLLSHCWLDGSLPDDVVFLARLVGMKPSQFARVWANSPLHECFTVRSERLVNERLETERRKQVEYRRRQSDNGTRGGRPKKQAEKDGNIKGLGSSGLAAGFETETQVEAKKSFASSSSSSPTVGTRYAGTGLTAPTVRQAPIVSKRRMDAAFEYGRLYVPQRAHQDLQALHPGLDLLPWYETVCETWTNGAQANANPGADMIKFWKVRHDEKWPPAGPAPKDTGPRTISAFDHPYAAHLRPTGTAQK